MPTFTNMATLSYNGNTINSNVVTGRIERALSAVKTAIVPTYSIGETVTYAISLVNTGTQALTNLTLTDDLGAYTVGGEIRYPLTYTDGSVRYFANGILQAPPDIEEAPPLQITGITVPAGGNVLIIYEAQANTFAPGAIGSTIVNTVTITGEYLADDVITQETITVAQQATPMITKALDPIVVPENGQLTYTFTIRNYGNLPLVATDDVILTDTFDPALTDITVMYNGEAWTEGVQYTYDPATGEFATLPGQIVVPAATFTQNEDGTWATAPGTVILTVTGRI